MNFTTNLSSLSSTQLNASRWLARLCQAKVFETMDLVSKSHIILPTLVGLASAFTPEPTRTSHGLVIFPFDGAQS